MLISSPFQLRTAETKCLICSRLAHATTATASDFWRPDEVKHSQLNSEPAVRQAPLALPLFFNLFLFYLFPAPKLLPASPIIATYVSFPEKIAA